MREERGLSDVIAFVLTFSVIILSVSAVSVLGVSQLSEVRDREQVNSAERSLVSFAKTIDDVSRQGERVRTAQIPLQDGDLRVRNSSVDVYVAENASTSNASWGGGRYDWNETVAVGALEHRLDKSFGEVALTYEAGSVFRHDIADGNDPQMRYGPAMRCAPEQGVAVVTLVELNGSFTRGAGSPEFDVDPTDPPQQDAPAQDAEQTVQLRADLDPDASGAVYANHTTTVNKTVFVNTSNLAQREGWNRNYLDDGDTGWEPVAGQDDLYRCSSDDGFTSVVVRRVVVDLAVVR